MSIYLDYAATTPLAPAIAQEMTTLLGQPWANPASQHAAGRRAQARLEEAKERVLDVLLGSAPASYQDWNTWQIVLTSGGTEANNLALNGLGGQNTPLLVGATEHPSVLTAAERSPALAGRSVLLPIDPDTMTPNIDVLEQHLVQLGSHHNQAGVQGGVLVSVMLGNNETGIMVDLPALSNVCRRWGAILHVDAVQAFGKWVAADYLPLIDAFTISAHKLQGPVGVGALIVRNSVALRPLLFGGGQQLERRPGTESVVLASALASACELADQAGRAGRWREVERLRLLFEQLLCDQLPLVQVIGKELPRLPHISSCAFPGRDRQGLLMSLDLVGVQCSTGSACASGSSQPSHVLAAMHLPPEWIQSTLRFSFGLTTTETEIHQAVEIISRTCT